MKRILLLLVLCLNISMVLGQEYKNWDKYVDNELYLYGVAFSPLKQVKSRCIYLIIEKKCEYKV